MSLYSTQRAGSPGYRIGRLFRANHALLARRLKNLPIRWGQVPLLLEVLAQEGQTQGQLSRNVHIDPAATTRALASLEDQGMVERVENPACRRDKLVYPTEAAQELFAVLQPVLQEHTDLLSKGFTEEEKGRILDFFDRMIANVEGALDSEDARESHS